MKRSNKKVAAFIMISVFVQEDAVKNLNLPPELTPEQRGDTTPAKTQAFDKALSDLQKENKQLKKEVESLGKRVSALEKVKEAKTKKESKQNPSNVTETPATNEKTA